MTEVVTVASRKCIRVEIIEIKKKSSSNPNNQENKKKSKEKIKMFSSMQVNQIACKLEMYQMYNRSLAMQINFDESIIRSENDLFFFSIVICVLFFSFFSLLKKHKKKLL